MKIIIDDAILKDFPDARIGWLTANVNVLPSSPHTDELKKNLVKNLAAINIDAESMKVHPDVARWREVYKAQGVKPSKYHCSLEALLRRTFKGDIWSVSNIVDCYDCVSAVNLLPMGAHDMAKLKGDMVLRRGRENEKFYPLGAGDSVIDVTPQNIVYADDEKVCCWLWNYRDTREAETCETTKRAVFIVDCAFKTEFRTVEQGLEALAAELAIIGIKADARGVADLRHPTQEVPD